MTDWGPEIEVNGKRPEWLGERDEALIENSPTQWLDWPMCTWHHYITRIRLPVDHPYYLATSKGFTYWPGGDDAPEDWDGGPVLYKCGAVQGNGIAEDWLTADWGADVSESQIIGYHRKSMPVTPGDDAFLAEASGDDGSPYYDVVINGHRVSCNDVIDALGLSFNHGELFKAAWRLGKKPGVSAKYDLDKIIYFANREAAKCQ